LPDTAGRSSIDTSKNHRVNWTRDDLWQAFLAFCDGRTPSEPLAAQFAQAVTADMHEPARSLRAASVSHLLHARLIRSAQFRSGAPPGG